MSDEQQVIAERRTGIGGSDAAAVIGVSPWRTPYDLWLEKIGETTPPPINEPMYWGTMLQPIIAAEYCRRTGRSIIEEPQMMRHPTHHWLIGHVDGQIIGEPRILEVKTAGISIGWGEPGSDQIPLEYLAQCHHYLALTGAKSVDVAVLIGGRDFRLYEVGRDYALINDLVAKEHEFWWHVEHREPPDPVNIKDAVRRWGRLHNPGAVVATKTDMEAIATLRECRTKHQELEVRENVAKLTIMQILSDGGDTLVDLDGTPLATWKLDSGRKAYSVKAREPARQFRLKGDNDEPT